MRFSFWSKKPSSSLSRSAQPRLLLLVGDEVVLLARDLLQEDQLLAGEVEGDAADVGHH